MHTQKTSAIVLRKIAGRLEACWSNSLHMASGLRTGGAAVPSIAMLAVALILMLIPMVLAAGLAALAVKAGGLGGVALATAPVATAQSIKDEILNAFEQFKAANDKELAEIKKSGEATAETRTLVNRLNDAISEMQAKLTRITIGTSPAGESEADVKARAKLQAFLCPNEEERDRGGQSKLSVSFSNARGVQGIQNAQSATTAGAGGAIVAPTFSNRLEKALLFFSSVNQNADTITTETGADLPWPTVNDTAQKGARLAENTTILAQDVAFSSVTLKAWMYTSKLILVPWQLMQDSAFAVEELIADLAGERVGRILNDEFTNGTGITMPNGLVAGATSGKVGIAGQTVSVIYDDLVDLIHSVNIAYRLQSKFMLADSSLKTVRKLKDSQGRPLWEPSLQADQPDLILGKQYVINDDMPAMAANAKSILFGDLSKYKVRRVKDIQLVRLNERYADALQTGFFAYCRFDGGLVNAGTNPLKFYQNSAT